ncbi:MAG: acyl carrier protein [Rickettsiaceae bacterium]|nr:MAG: acyl carrier protein [Rickettsiaceae bacterium]
MDDIEQKISDAEKEIIGIAAKLLKVDANTITSQSSFVGDLSADSLDQVELMMAIEAHFGCEIPDEEATNITTVSEAANYVVKHSKQAAKVS